MARLALTLVLAGLLGPAGPEQQAPTVRELIELQRWPEALKAADAEVDPVARERARTEILFRAGDLAGALRVALRGLEAAPDDLVLLWRASQISLTLGLEGSAGRHVRRLRDAVASTSLSAEQREWWGRQVAGLDQESHALAGRDAAREAAVLRARWAVGVGLVGCLIVLVALSRRRSRSLETAPPA